MTNLVGEQIEVNERLIISPTNGVFHPHSVLEGAPSRSGGGTPIQRGDSVGRVGDVEVLSSFTGNLMGCLVLPGERVHPSQAVAWLVIAEAR